MLQELCQEGAIELLTTSHFHDVSVFLLRIYLLILSKLGCPDSSWYDFSSHDWPYDLCMQHED